jgi:anti-anti-sigma factor
MKISLRKTETYQIFDILSPLTMDDSEKFETAIFRNIDHSIPLAIINLGDMTYITSPILGSFVRIQRTLKEKDIRLALLTTSPELNNLFIITGTSQFFTVYRSESDIPKQ